MPITGNPGSWKIANIDSEPKFREMLLVWRKEMGHISVYFSSCPYGQTGYIRRACFLKRGGWSSFGWMWILILWLLNGLGSDFGSVFITTEKLARGQAQGSTSIVKLGWVYNPLWFYGSTWSRKRQAKVGVLFCPVSLRKVEDMQFLNWLRFSGSTAGSPGKPPTSSWVWLRGATSSGRASASREHTLWL